MKATGMVRRVDDLGRVVIPKEVRRVLRIREGDSLEIYISNEGVVFKKYSPLGEFEFVAKDYAESLGEISKRICLITNTAEVIATSARHRKALHEPIGPFLEDIIQSGKSYHSFTSGTYEILKDIDGTPQNHTSLIVIPIKSGEVVEGTVVMLTESEDDGVMNEQDLKLAQTAATFLSKQIQ